VVEELGNVYDIRQLLKTSSNLEHYLTQLCQDVPILSR